MSWPNNREPRSADAIAQDGCLLYRLTREDFLSFLEAHPRAASTLLAVLSRRLRHTTRVVQDATFRHGRVFGAPTGEPAYRYYAEWEFPDRSAFDAAARSPEFRATGKDAMEMGGRFTVLFAEVE